MLDSLRTDVCVSDIEAKERRKARENGEEDSKEGLAHESEAAGARP